MRLSRVMAGIATAGIVLIVGLMAMGFIIPDWTRNMLLARLGQTGAVLPVTPGARLAAAIVCTVPTGVMVWGLWHVRALFREFAQGRVLTESAARHLQLFGASLFLQGPLGPLTSLALTIALTLSNPFGERVAAMTVSINDYLAVVIGGVSFAAAAVMREAARLADENASFI
ncbi:MAG: DUF2975 domain-containing protein [Xanthobacteraceae bacterium]